MNEFTGGGESRQTPDEITHERVGRTVSELARRKLAGEIERTEFGVEDISHFQAEDQPLTRKAVGNRAVVLSQSELDQLEWLEFVSANGDLITIESGDTGYQQDDLLIIFPEELG